MNSLITTDLHFTNNPNDEYRWGLFPWLREQIIAHNVKKLFLLGDITDAKDNHHSKLVNRVVDELCTLHDDTGVEEWILRGNHDGLDPNCPYFRFLSHFDFIKFIQTPFMVTFDLQNVLMLPHTRDPLKDWAHVEMYDANFILMHATVHGAISETGHTLGGVTQDIFKRAPHAKIYSGDVHVPQVSGRVEYIGTPYQVRFGTQRHECRVLLLKDWRTPVDLHFPALWRYILDVVPVAGKIKWPEGLRKGDQVKIRIHLTPEEYVDWTKYGKQALQLCNEQGLEMCGMQLVRVKPRVQLKAPQQIALRSPEEILRHYCAQQKVDKTLIDVGMQLLKEAK